MQSQKEITASTPLLNPDGSLAQVGWSPQPMLDCNLEDAHFYRMKFMQPLRLKRWDYYGVTTPSHYFSFTVSHIGYLGMIFAYVVDFEKPGFHEESIVSPLGRGVILPRNSTGGETLYQNSRVQLRFHVSGDNRKLQVNWSNFENNQPLTAEIDLHAPPDFESMNIVIPIEERRFYFNRKINCLPAAGQIQYRGETYQLDPQTTLGNLDWGRGVWAYRSFWVWASASGFMSNGDRLGLNLGYGFGDTTAASENAFILNNQVHKLGKVAFEYNSGDFMQPWKMKSDDGRLDLVFTPFLDREAKTDVKLLYSEVHQMFGRYEGTLKTEDGRTIQVKDLIGFAEEHHARW